LRNSIEEVIDKDRRKSEISEAVYNKKEKQGNEKENSMIGDFFSYHIHNMCIAYAHRC
jgi:hypothetical protein